MRIKCSRRMHSGEVKTLTALVARTGEWRRFRPNQFDLRGASTSEHLAPRARCCLTACQTYVEPERHPRLHLRVLAAPLRRPTRTTETGSGRR